MSFVRDIAASNRVGGAMLFSEEELWNVSGMRLGEGFVEVTCE
jgi:hypothetical protein